MEEREQRKNKRERERAGRGWRKGLIWLKEFTWRERALILLHSGTPGPYKFVCVHIFLPKLGGLKRSSIQVVPARENWTRDKKNQSKYPLNLFLFLVASLASLVSPSSSSSASLSLSLPSQELSYVPSLPIWTFSWPLISSRLSSDITNIHQRQGVTGK